MKAKRKLRFVFMAITMLWMALGYAEAETHLFPIEPAPITAQMISADEAVVLAKDAMMTRQHLTVDDLYDSTVKAGFVVLENGENAWMVMIDSPWGTDALVTLSASGKEIIDYQATDQQRREIITILLQQWRAQKGDIRTWSIEDKALFDWLFGEATAYIVPGEGDISKEEAAEIAVEAVPDSISTPRFSFSFKLFTYPGEKQAQRIWLVTIYEGEKERYVVHVSSADGTVVKVVRISEFG